MTTSKRFCLFNLGTSRLYTRLLDGTFPPYEQAIPTDADKTLRVNREHLTSSLRRVAVFSETATKMVKLSLEPDLLRLTAQAHDVGRAQDTVVASYAGEPFQIGFNAVYLLDLLRTMDSEEITLAFREPTAAGIFTPVVKDGTPDLLCLVMPLRLPEESPEEKEELSAED